MLYKYYSEDAQNFALSEKGLSLRISQAGSLNDPFESNPAIDKFADDVMTLIKKERIEEGQITQESTKALLDEYIIQLKEKFKKSTVDLNAKISNSSYGIVSLSANRSSTPMWAYYASEGKGFLVAIKTKKVEKSEKVSILEKTFEKVDYSSIRPEFNRDTLNNTKHLLKKDISWKHENEFRTVIDLNEYSAVRTDINGYPVHQFFIPKKLIAYIVLGYQSSDALERRIRFWIETCSPNTKLYKAIVRTNRYAYIYEVI